ncbi:MAG TPA: hypothetical protein VFG52_11815, partial [Xanthomonadales bacterium]|nr:hypothetical protein [Xanthomonadales bacterium]
ELDSVKIPTIGTWYFLSARHCLYADGEFYTGQFLGDECVAGGNPNSIGLVTETGGGAGHSNYSNTFTHYLQTPDPGDAPEAVDELGTVYGAINFSGPIGMPILRGSSTPTDLGRTNSNLFAFQQYNFNGTETTPLELVVDIDYSIQSDSIPTYFPPENSVRPNEEIQVGSRPGGAGLALTMAVVDATLVPSVAMLTQEFGNLLCGNEAALQLPNGDPWPAGSILGSAVFKSPDIQEGVQSIQLDIRACDGTSISTDPVLVDPADSFYLAAYLQAPARGKLKQDGTPAADDSGYLDAASTIKVILDPDAPAEVLQQLMSGVETACDNCGPPYVETIFREGFE